MKLLSMFRFIAAVFLIAAFSVFFSPIKDVQALGCQGTYKVVKVAAWDKLNMRSGPGTAFPVITKLAPGEGCIIKTGERYGSWVRVNYADVSGWVHGRYLQRIW